MRDRWDERAAVLDARARRRAETEIVRQWAKETEANSCSAPLTIAFRYVAARSRTGFLEGVRAEAGGLFEPRAEGGEL